MSHDELIGLMVCATGSQTWTATWSRTIGANGAMYGYSVAISGDFLAVGSPSDNFEFKNDQGNVWRV